MPSFDALFGAAAHLAGGATAGKVGAIGAIGANDGIGPVATVAASAPGRLKLIGEHTDYNGGLVLPVATPQRSHVEIRPRTDGQVCAWSAGGGRAAVAANDPGDRGGHGGNGEAAAAMRSSSCPLPPDAA